MHPTLKRLARRTCPPFIWDFVAAHRPRKLAPAVEERAVKDSFALWMGFINPGMLDGGNIELFSHCINNLPSEAPIIEIGSFAGKSLNYLIHLVRRTDRTNRVFSVDEWAFEGALAPDEKIGGVVPFGSYRAHVIDSFRRNVKLFSGDRLPHHMPLSSDAFFHAWAENETRTDFFGQVAELGGSISFAYIDGDHTYAQSKKDFENVNRFLEPGGFIVFDDSADGSGMGSMQTAQEAADLPQYEIVAKNPNYCIRKNR
jgi:SAM-dependent methyltransferase